jgi:hypothetical protein
MSYVQYNPRYAEITIDESKLIKKLGIADQEIEARLPEALMDAALEGRNYWETLAGQRLNSSRERYIEALGMEQKGDSVTLKLTGDFAVMREVGSQPFDMKPGFLASKKMKLAPFKKKIPRAIAASIQGSRMTKWMVIPLNTQRMSPMGKPGAYRTFTDAQSGWLYKKTLKGVFIADDVADELSNVILPKHIEKLIDEIMGS